MKTKFTPAFAAKAAIVISVLLLGANLFQGFVLLHNSTAAMKTLIQNRMLDISNTAADMLDGDILKSLTAEDAGSEEYQTINDTLDYFQRNIDLKYIYTVRDNGDKTFSFMVDPAPEDPGIFGDPVVYTDALYTASQGTAAVDEEPYSDAWGSFYSSYSPVFDSQGHVAGVVAVDFDAQWYDAQIAKQRRSIVISTLISILIAILLVLIATNGLRKLVRSMTADLSDALNVAEEANRAKTVFLSNMSHEMRTPMNAIIGLDRIALDDPTLSDNTREHLEKIGASADHLLALINDVLDMSRIEAGRMSLKQETFSLSKLLEQINVIIGGQCRDKNLKWNLIKDGFTEEYYIGDDMKLRQIIINILGNSVKFTPEGGRISFIIEKTGSFDGKSAFRLTMTDTGIGMSSEYLTHLFDPFSQEGSSSQSKYGSTGLGMSITKSLVEIMNGEISVESEKDAGTTFVVSLTLEDSQETAPAQESTAEEKESPNKDLSGIHVLVAEDVAVNAEILKMILSGKQIEMDHAENGRIAVEMFEKSSDGYYSAILMDMRMPEMDGLEATRAIRALERSDARAIPIIALTANAFSEDVQRSLQSGLNAHLSKPIVPEELFKTLENLIQ